MTGALPEGWLVLEGTSDPSPPVDRAALRAVLACVRGDNLARAQRSQIRQVRSRSIPDSTPQYIRSLISKNKQYQEIDSHIRACKAFRTAKSKSHADLCYNRAWSALLALGSSPENINPGRLTKADILALEYEFHQQVIKGQK